MRLWKTEATGNVEIEQNTTEKKVKEFWSSIDWIYSLMIKRKYEKYSGKSTSILY